MTATTHDRFIVAAILVIMAALLWILPAGAQCDPGDPGAPDCNDLETWPVIEPDPEPAIASQLYLPMITTDTRTWFTPAELDAAQLGYGFDPAIVAEHTWCELAPSALPPAVIRYDHCLQHWYAGQPTDGRLAVYYWFDGATVRALLISSTSIEE